MNTSYLVVISRDGYVNNEQTIRVVNNKLASDKVSASLNRMVAPVTVGQNQQTQNQTQAGQTKTIKVSIYNNPFELAYESYIRRAGTTDWGESLGQVDYYLHNISLQIPLSVNTARFDIRLRYRQNDRYF